MALRQRGKRAIGLRSCEVNEKVALLAADGFAQQSTITAAGASSRGMFVTTPVDHPRSCPEADSGSSKICDNGSETVRSSSSYFPRINGVSAEGLWGGIRG